MPDHLDSVWMDPALHELIERHSADQEVEVIARLVPGRSPPPELRMVARFGEIATGRVPSSRIAELHAHPDVLSLKAPRLVSSEVMLAERFDKATDLRPEDERRPADLVETGRGAVVAVLDWGCDFAHDDFRHEDGRTRLLAIWDQRGGAHEKSAQPYGYGRVHTAAEIDAALRVDSPYEFLGYHPGDGDALGTGTHGTHVMSIAAGSGVAGPAGMAPDADLLFVHLTNRDTEGLANLGDSVTILEAFGLRQCAGG